MMKRFSIFRIVYFVLALLLMMLFLLFAVASIGVYGNDLKMMFSGLLISIAFFLWPAIIFVYLGLIDFIYGYKILSREIPEGKYPIHIWFHALAIINTYLLVFFVTLIFSYFDTLLLAVTLFLFFPPTVLFWFLTFIYRIFHSLYDWKLNRKEIRRSEKIRKSEVREIEKQRKSKEREAREEDRKVQDEKDRVDAEYRKKQREYYKNQQQQSKYQQQEAHKLEREQKQKERKVEKSIRASERKYKKDLRSYEKLIKKYKKERDKVREELKKNRWKKIGGIMVNEKEGRVSFCDSEYRYSDIKGTKLLRETHTERDSYNWHSGSSKRHPSILGMLVGAIFAGFIGAILGGNSRSRTYHSGYSGGHSTYDKKCHYLAVKVTLTTDIKDIVFIKGSGISEMSKWFRELLHDAEITKQELDRLSRTPEPRNIMPVESEPEYQNADKRVKDLEAYYYEFKRRGPQLM